MENSAPFTFVRLRYQSGDWDTDQRMPSNLINSLVEYTQLPVNPKEIIVDLSSKDVFKYPFLYISGHRLVQFTKQEASNFTQYLLNGGFVFADDCNHDIDGLFAKSFEAEIALLFGRGAMKQVQNNHPIYSCFFHFEKGPPNTSFELNGWGDDLIHDHLKALFFNNRIGLLYSNKDYGCEWDYDFRNKRFLAEDNTKFGVNIIMYALTR